MTESETTALTAAAVPTAHRNTQVQYLRMVFSPSAGRDSRRSRSDALAYGSALHMSQTGQTHLVTGLGTTSPDGTGRPRLIQARMKSAQLILRSCYSGSRQAMGGNFELIEGQRHKASTAFQTRQFRVPLIGEDWKPSGSSTRLQG